MSRNSTLTLVVGLTLATAMIFVADLYTMAGFAHGMLYVLVVLIALLSGHRRLLLATTGICVALIGVGFFLSPALIEPFPSSYMLANRGASIALVILTASLALARMNQGDRLRQARQDLAESDRMLKVASEVAGVGGWSVELDPPRLHWTSEVHRIHGTVPGEEPTLEEGINFYDTEHRGRIRRAVERCIADGVPFDEELRVVNRSGRPIWVRSVGVPTLDKDGAIVGMHGAFMDIEQSKRTARRLTTTLESITNAFILLDRNWRFVFMNSRAEDMLDRTREDLLGQELWEEFPDAVGSVFEDNYRYAMSENKPTSFEAYYRPFDRWFEVNAFPSDEGLAVYFEDVSSRRRSEQQLRLLEAAIGRINDAVMITEADPLDEPGPRIVFVNDAFERMTGYSRDEVIGRSPRLLQGPETSREELDRVRQALEELVPVRTQVLNYTKHGRKYWQEMDIVPILDIEGDREYFVAIERDLTERLSIEEQLRQSQRLEAVGQLTGGIAHDFNNLLTVILGNAEHLRDELSGNPGLSDIAALMALAAERGAQLTQRLLAFARRQALDPKPVNVNLLVAGMEGLLRRTLGAHIEIELAQGAGLWLAFVDEGQLESCLLNLCLNARDAMDGGGKLTIETGNVCLDPDYARQHGEVEPGEYVMLAVTDSGRGMAPEQIERVFEPFYTTKAKGKGTGLGLSMIYGFVKQSNGHIKIYSEPGEGTTVKVYLPRAPSDAILPAPRVEDVAQAGNEVILLAEDDDLVREFAHARLSELGYRVLVAENGPEALELVKQHADIDLMFTDVVMPGGMSGRELAEQAIALRPGLKVLYTSGYAENAIVHHGRLDPGVELLSKPYSRSDLASRIRSILSSERSQLDQKS